MSNKIIKAIQKINPTAQVTVTDEDINSIVWENGTTPISVADIQAQIPIVEQEIANEKAQKEADALAGNNKLLELGLTQAQVTAMTGYTPPVAE
jgi:predicted RNA binding protein with dsRBD fold (UPF0201 family)